MASPPEEDTNVRQIKANIISYECEEVINLSRKFPIETLPPLQTSHGLTASEPRRLLVVSATGRFKANALLRTANMI